MNNNFTIPACLQEKFEFYNYDHALEILSSSYPGEWNDILYCLENFEISVEDLKSSGGNESRIPKIVDNYLYPLGWREIRIAGDLVVKMYPRRSEQRGRFSDEPFEEIVQKDYIDGHNIDFLKNRVAFDLEWNSKDQTFDRDLFAMKTYHDCGIISVGVILTRAEELNEIFRDITLDNGKRLMSKYGASTTWMGKLLYRLDSRRNGGCPVLAIGIRKKCVKGY